MELCPEALIRYWLTDHGRGFLGDRRVDVDGIEGAFAQVTAAEMGSLDVVVDQPAI